MFSISTSHMPNILTYKKAAAKFEATKPWRGVDPNVRALAERRAKHKCIIKRADSSYAMRLHNTDVVTYYPNGDVRVRVGGWNTISTRMFAAYVLPFGVELVNHQDVPYLGTVTGFKGMAYYRTRENEWIIRQTAESTHRYFEVVNKDDLVQDTIRRLDREITRKIREHIKPFEEYVRAVQAISGGDMTEFAESVIGTKPMRLLLDGATPEDYPHILRDLCDRSWSNSARGVRMYLKASWKEILRWNLYKHANAFVHEPVPLGELPPKKRY